jgi:CDP-diacylglycerol--glycerol-3-phosphate 3-phosphatidyltransferase
MTLYRIKPRFQIVLRTLAAALARRGISADRITVWGVGCAAVAGALLALAGHSYWLWLVPPLLFARIACNALDGMVARLAGTARPWGTILNETSDRIADVVCFGGLILGGALPPLVAALLLPLLLFVSYIGIVGQAAGGPRCYSGPLGKADRMALLGLYCLIAPFVDRAGWLIGWALIVGLGLTACNRLWTLARQRHTLHAALAEPQTRV